MNKVCKHGLDYIWISNAKGDVRMCGWAMYFLGNLVDNTIEELWNSEKAEIFRQSMLDGSYRFCNKAKCPYLANDKLDELLVDYDVPELPLSVNIGYQLQCNYKCVFCRKDYYKACDCEKKWYNKIENEIRKMLPNLKKISTNGAGEFFCSPSIVKLLTENDIPENAEIEVESNGLFFTLENWKKIKKFGDHNLSVDITVHSFNDSTYRFLSGTNMPVSKVMENLDFISSLREKNIINKFEIATVVSEYNFREMPDFVKTCLDRYSMDTIRIRFYEPYQVWDADTEWFFDVRNKYHPYHHEFERVFSDSVFENPKVWKWQGNQASLERESPYTLEKRRSDAVAKLILFVNLKEKLNKYIESRNIRNIALYGGGTIGRAVIKILDCLDRINIIFDTYVEEQCDGYKILKPDTDLLNKFDLIIITSEIAFVDIVDQLKRKEYHGEYISLSEFTKDLSCE